MIKYLIVLMLVTGCTYDNTSGACIGLLDKGEPGIRYELSIWNVAMGIIFSETIIVPVVVIAKATQCPVESSK